MEEIHPFKRIRYANKLSQNELASQVGITNQVILRSEQGLYGIPTPKLTEFLAQLPIESAPVAELDKLYREWQRSHRMFNKQRIESHVNRWRNGTGVIVTMPEFRVLMGQPSVLGLCKLMCVHPSQVDRYTRKGGSLFFLEEALRDILTEDDVVWVKRHLRPL